MNEVRNVGKWEWDNGITSAVNIMPQIKSRLSNVKFLYNQLSLRIKFIVCENVSIVR